jgi:antitoxin (DNA-binding transcriptional repressor) of toxin-antitoxin stability system
MKKAANIRVRPGGMERLREIAAQHGAISRSGINAGEASVSELLDRVVTGELVIVERERMMVSIKPVTESLLHVYPRQSEPQDCFISLDTRDGELTADWNPEIGNAVPSDVYHGFVRRYPIPVLQPATVNALMESIAPLAQRVIDGTERHWNGANHVARLSDAARDAEAEIEQSLPVEGDVETAEAYEWLYEERETILERLAAGETVETLMDEFDGDGSEGSPLLIGLRQYLESLPSDMES